MINTKISDLKLFYFTPILLASAARILSSKEKTIPLHREITVISIKRRKQSFHFRLLAPQANIHIGEESTL